MTTHISKLCNEADALQAEAHALALPYRTTLSSIHEKYQLELEVAKPASQHFPQFKAFPPEIQEMIWERAMAVRVCNVLQPGRVIPGAAHACRLSRAVFFRMFPECEDALEYSGTEEPYDQLMFLSPGFSAAFFPAKETGSGGVMAIAVAVASPDLIFSSGFKVSFAQKLKVAPGMGGPGRSRPHPLEEHVEGVGALSAHFPRYLANFPPQAFLNKSIGLLVGGITQVDGSWGRPDLVRALFQGDQSLLIDLEDHDELARVERIMKQFQQSWTIRGRIRPDDEMIHTRSGYFSMVTQHYDEDGPEWREWSVIRHDMMAGLGEVLARYSLPWEEDLARPRGSQSTWGQNPAREVMLSSGPVYSGQYQGYHVTSHVTGIYIYT